MILYYVPSMMSSLGQTKLGKVKVKLS